MSTYCLSEITKCTMIDYMKKYRYRYNDVQCNLITAFGIRKGNYIAYTKNVEK